MQGLLTGYLLVAVNPAGSTSIAALRHVGSEKALKADSRGVMLGCHRRYLSAQLGRDEDDPM